MLASLSDMSTAVIKGVAEGFENMYAETIKAKIRWGLLGSLGSLLTAGYYFHQGNTLFGYAFIITTVMIPFFDTSSTYSHILAGKKRFDIQSRFNITTRIFSALVLIGTIFITKNVLFILLAYFLPYILIGFIIGPIALKKLSLNDRYDPNTITYGEHLSFLSAISFGISYLDSIIVFHFLGPVQLAIYSIAGAPATRLQALFSVIPEIALPKLAERSTEELKATIMQKILRSMIPACLIVGLYMFAVPIFFKFFLPKYADSIPYAMLLAIPLIWYPFVIISRILSAKGATKFLYQYNIIGSIVQLSLVPVMIYYFGLMGAVLGRIIMSLFGNSLMLYFFRKL